MYDIFFWKNKVHSLVWLTYMLIQYKIPWLRTLVNQSYFLFWIWEEQFEPKDRYVSIYEDFTTQRSEYNVFFSRCPGRESKKK